jgi:riboflavin synthase
VRIEMFNGIIEVVGTVTRLKRLSGGGASLEIDTGKLARFLKPGTSIAVDGCCLTTVTRRGRRVIIDISAETWNKTNLRARRKNSRVNLEVPLTANTMVSGHFVQGHVEGVGTVTAFTRHGDDVRLEVGLSDRLMRFCIPKGSIAINGVSLTVAEMKKNRVEIALIPYTLEHTNLGELEPGDPVNIETDMLGRYVVGMMEQTWGKRKTGRAAGGKSGKTR